MDKQEAVDIMVRHLLTQGCRSGTDDRCMLRGPNGTKCAVGCLIPDDKYSESMDDTDLSDIVENVLGLPWGFVEHFVYIHDTKDVEDWRKELLGLCEELGVVFNEP